MWVSVFVAEKNGNYCARDREPDIYAHICDLGLWWLLAKERERDADCNVNAADGPKQKEHDSTAQDYYAGVLLRANTFLSATGREQTVSSHISQ